MIAPKHRRLLDIAMRKNPERHANHYIFMRRHDAHALNNLVAALELEEDDAQTAMKSILVS